METLTVMPVNNLKHRISTPSMDIDISLADDCKNGHNDFSITATIWEPSKPRTDRYMIAGGCCHEEILKRRSDLKPFVDLHLSDAKGAPMYAEANGFYYLKQVGKAATMDYLRITEDEYNTLLPAEDVDYFNYLLNNVLHIPARWEEEAKQATLLLEEMTGKKFNDDSIRYQYIPLSDEKAAEIKGRIENGYYAAEAIKARETAKYEAKKAKIIEELTNDRDIAVRKAQNEYDVKLYVLNSGLSLDNFIYYTHTNKGVFNWKDYDKKISREQFDTFVSNLDLTQLPKGITFGFSEK